MLAFAVGLALLSQTPAPPHPDLSRLPEVDSYLRTITGYGYSGYVLMVKGGRVIFDKGYGYADRERKTPWTGDTLFEIGSVSKQFTAVCVMKLEQEGRLTRRSTLGELLSNVPEDKKNITVEQILTHSSGITGGPEEYRVVDKDTVVQFLLNAPLRFEPGTKSEYSNGGYTILAAIVEQVSRTPFMAYLKEHVIKPAGLQATWGHGELLPKAKPEKIAMGYEFDGPLEDLTKWSGLSWYSAGSGGMTSTANDLYRWHMALLNGKVLPRSIVDDMRTPRVVSEDGMNGYGFGWWNIKTKLGSRLITHGGDGWAFGVDIRWYPDEDLYMLIACNVRDDVYPVINRASRVIPLMLWKLPYTEAPRFKAGDRSTQAILGDYKLATGGRLRIEKAADGFRIGAIGQDAVDALEPAPEDERKLRAEIGELALRVFRGAEAGDFAAMDQVVGPRNAKMFRDGWKYESADLSRGKGTLKGIVGLGTYPAGRPGCFNAILRFDYTNGYSMYNACFTTDRTIVESTLRCPSMAASMPVQVESRDHFVGWSLRRNAGVAFTVQGDRLTLHQIGSSDVLGATKVD